MMSTESNDNGPEYDAALDEVLKSLRGDYLKELPERIAEMKDFVERAKCAEEKQLEWLTEAHFIAHRLAGTAGSYGFAELSRTAAEMDLYLKKLLKSDVESSSVANRLNWQLLDRLVEAVAGSVPAGAP